jgi:dihydroorotase
MLLIKNCTILESKKEKRVDVLIEGNKIVKISSAMDVSEAEIIDANGNYLLPGIIDLNIQIKDNVLNQKNLQQLKESARKAGVTMMALRPTFTPQVEHETFLEFLNTNLKDSYPTIIPTIKATKNGNENRLNDISTLIKNGASAICENSFINGNLIRRALQYSNMKERPFFCTCTNPDLNDNGVMNEGNVSSLLGLPGISKISQISEVAKVVAMAEYYEAHVLLQGISTEKSLNIIFEAKKSNKNIYAETSIHHLVLNDESCDDFNTYAKIAPPLSDESERVKLVGALKDGKIDTISSAHSPKSIVYKDVAFYEAEYGVDAIEDFLSLCYTFLVKPKVIPFELLSKKISLIPANVLGLSNIGEIKDGYEADLILFDKNKKRVVEDVKSLYFGKTLYGEITHTICQGEIQ